MQKEAHPMRTNIDIDDALMAEARKLSGQATKKQTVEQALRLLIRLRRQQAVEGAFGKYRWRGNLARTRKRRGITVRRTIDLLIGTWCIENHTPLLHNDSDFHPMARHLGLIEVPLTA
jgi:Arc/MetJ family transcription regulator